MKKLFIYSTNTNGFNTVGGLQIENLFPESAIVYRKINDNNSFLLLRDNISSLPSEAMGNIQKELIDHMSNFDKIYIVIHSTGIRKDYFLNITGFVLLNKCHFFPNASHVRNNPYYMTAVRFYNEVPTALQDALKVFEGDHGLAEKLTLLHQCLDPNKLNKINAPDSSLIEDLVSFKKKITEKRLSAVDEAYVKELLALREKWLANA